MHILQTANSREKKERKSKVSIRCHLKGFPESELVTLNLFGFFFYIKKRLLDAEEESHLQL